MMRGAGEQFGSKGTTQMKMNLPIATARIGRELLDAHAAIDSALVATTALLHSTAVARADNPEIDSSLGTVAMLRLHKSLGGLLNVRADVLRAHKSLNEDAKIVMGPDEVYCPPAKAGLDSHDDDQSMAA